MNSKIIVYDPDYFGWDFPNDILSTTKNIKAIFLGTTDKSYLDLELCKKKTIDVFNIPKYASSSVAEYLVMYMFVLAKKIPLQLKNNNRQDFSSKYMQMELKNKKVGIIGLGNIGNRVAQMCDGIGMKVYYWNRRKKDTSYIYLELSDLFKQCDVIYLCLSINAETKRLITDDMLNHMKKDTIFISATGKQLFDSNIIERRINNNELYGYAFEEPNKPLVCYGNNTMVTSEYGWFTKEASKFRIKLWIDSILNYLKEEIR